MIKAFIIDDEKHCIVTLEHLLKKHPQVQLVGTTQDSTLAKDLILQHEPHLVFLDIEMPQQNGFDVLQQFDTLPFKVVFTTAYDQYALKALRLNAFDYLLKPIAANDIAEVLTKYENNEIDTSKSQAQNLHLFNSGKMQDTIALSTQQGLLFVKIEDIAYLEADSCYTKIWMQDKTKYLASKTLSNFEDVLMDNAVFFRPHKSYIVNLKFIKQYIRGDGGELIMHNGVSIAVSRNKKQEFLDLFMKV
jgi:two-component system, LytTR family, response regulator